jgi:hypothetical protein
MPEFKNSRIKILPENPENKRKLEKILMECGKEPDLIDALYSTMNVILKSLSETKGPRKKFKK